MKLFHCRPIFQVHIAVLRKMGKVYVQGANKPGKGFIIDKLFEFYHMCFVLTKFCKWIKHYLGKYNVLYNIVFLNFQANVSSNDV